MGNNVLLWQSTLMKMCSNASATSKMHLKAHYALLRLFIITSFQTPPRVTHVRRIFPFPHSAGKAVLLLSIFCLS